jgi:DNA polymerase-3 subunit epsilon
MRDFAAIDFETANEVRSSVCSVGVVIVRDCRITESLYRLIHPKPNYYRFTGIHGLSDADTKEAPPFPEVWTELAPYLAGLPLVAHYSVFDAGCLRAAHEAYGMEYPDYTFYCTCETSRRIFGDTLPNHKLPTVAKRCGYDLDNHHHALADAEACARIALKIL